MTDTRGRASARYLGKGGAVGHSIQSEWNFLYETSLTQDPEWWVGDRVILADGREYVYAKSAGQLYAAHGAAFTYTGLTSYTAFGTSHAAGSSEITVPAATHAALTKNELRGGYIIIFDGASDYATCTRGIVGNEASAADAAITVYLDADITNAIVSGTEACEVYRNPYYAVGVASDAAYPIAGVPTTHVAATATFFWLQTKGMCWVAPQGTVKNNEGVGCMWRHDGSLEAVATALTATVPDGDSTQYAGHRVAGSYDGNGPLFNLNG